ncbi:hypothetical protein GCM10010420_11550 [Streptomyces glaucosporus]|uniref:vWA found in TerF C terminus domain-containing protein n=1 Tax=Streptomyces glaucosporus TaxID=284044 RepID=A0ABP5UX01_9ACTN
MSSAGIRVALVLPTSWEWYFEPQRKHSIAGYAEKALKIAGKISPGSGVEVFLYGEPVNSEGTEVVRSRLEPGSLSEWVREWGVRPNAHRRVYDEPVPANRAEEHFGTGEQPWYGRPLPAVRAVNAWASGTDDITFVIFWLDRKTETEEMIRFIGESGNEKIFWQFFGESEEIYDTFWSRDSLSQRQVLPNVWFCFDEHWSRRAISRGFAQWREKTAAKT